MTKAVNLILVPQEFSTANHVELWKEIARNSKNLTVVINIPADLFVTVVKKKFYRLKEAFNEPKYLNDNLVLLRPLYLLRPEISNKFINKINSFCLKKELKKIDVDIEGCHLNILYYDGKLLELLDNLSQTKSYFYYLMDEVRYDAHNNEINEKRFRNDVMACDRSEFIFLMSRKLIEPREEYSSKMKVIGNGASHYEDLNHIKKIGNSIGLIGNIRNWIDQDLLENIISTNQDKHFGLIGNIEENMQVYIDKLTKKYSNVKYYGVVKKSEIHEWYKKFRVLIVPYKQNEFMMATRPIKIVESIFAKTPVVTIPISGYNQSAFIKFATSEKEFTNEINFLIKNDLDTNSIEFKEFIRENSWDFKAKEILKEFY